MLSRPSPLDDVHRLAVGILDHGGVVAVHLNAHSQEFAGGIEHVMGVAAHDHIDVAHAFRQNLIKIVAQMTEHDELVDALILQGVDVVTHRQDFIVEFHGVGDQGRFPGFLHFQYADDGDLFAVDFLDHIGLDVGAEQRAVHGRAYVAGDYRKIHRFQQIPKVRFAFVEFVVAQFVGVQADGVKYFEVHFALEQAEVQGAVEFATVENQGVVITVFFDGGGDAGEAAETEAHWLATHLIFIVVQ